MQSHRRVELELKAGAADDRARAQPVLAARLVEADHVASAELVERELRDKQKEARRAKKREHENIAT